MLAGTQHFVVGFFDRFALCPIMVWRQQFENYAFRLGSISASCCMVLQENVGTLSDIVIQLAHMLLLYAPCSPLTFAGGSCMYMPSVRWASNHAQIGIRISLHRLNFWA